MTRPYLGALSGTLHIMAKGHLKGDADINSLVVDEMGVFNGKSTMKESNEISVPIVINDWKASAK